MSKYKDKQAKVSTYKKVAGNPSAQGFIKASPQNGNRKAQKKLHRRLNDFAGIKSTGGMHRPGSMQFNQ